MHTYLCLQAGAFGKIYGPAFEPQLPRFMDAMLKFAKASRPASDRAMAIGYFAEVFQNMKVRLLYLC